MKKEEKIKLLFETEFDKYQQKEIKNLISICSVIAPEIDSDSKRSSLDIVGVVDISGSMSDKMDLTKKTLEFVVSQLTKNDNFGIVLYETDVTVLFEMIPMDEEGKKTAIKKIKTIMPEDMTNLSDGLFKGLEMMNSRKSFKDVSSILLFTDGLASCGVTKDVNEIIKTIKGENTFEVENKIERETREVPDYESMTDYDPFKVFGEEDNDYGNTNFFRKKKNKKKKQKIKMKTIHIEKKSSSLKIGGKKVDFRKSCTINCFGFGEDHDARFMKKISDIGNGNYYFIETSEAISDSFINCLGGLLTTVGKNVKVSLKTKNDAKIKTVHTGYTLDIIEEGKEYEILMPDIQSEERRDILLEFKIPECGNEVNTFEVVEMSVEYEHIVNKEIYKESMRGIVLRTEDAKETEQVASERVVNTKNRVNATKLLEDITVKGEQMQFEEAQKDIDDAIFNFQQTNNDFNNDLVSEMKTVKRKMNRKEFKSNRNWIQNNIDAHSKQRNTNFSVRSQKSYMNKGRKKLLKKFKGEE